LGETSWNAPWRFGVFVAGRLTSRADALPDREAGPEFSVALGISHERWYN